MPASTHDTRCTSSPPASTLAAEKPLVSSSRTFRERLRDTRPRLVLATASRRRGWWFSARCGRRTRSCTAIRSRASSRARPQGICHEIALELAKTSPRISGALRGTDLPEAPADVRRWTDGNPFFLASIDHVLEQGLLVKSDEGGRSAAASMPARRCRRLRAVIEPRLDRLTLDELMMFGRRASSSRSSLPRSHLRPSDGDLGDVEVVEHLCDGLVRRQEILRTAGEHVLMARRARVTPSAHALPAGRLPAPLLVHLPAPPSGDRREIEAAYAGSTRDVASELAAHFEQGDVEQAIRP